MAAKTKTKAKRSINKPKTSAGRPDDQRDQPSRDEHGNHSIENDRRPTVVAYRPDGQRCRRRLETTEAGLATVGRDEIGRRERGRRKKRLLIEREPVISSIMSEIGYNASMRTLEILFKSGAIYLYYFVPEQVHRDLMNAASHGTYFAQNIKLIYEHHRIAEPSGTPRPATRKRRNRN